MKIESTEQAIEKIIDYAKALHEFQLQKKAIDEDVKDLKIACKEDGVNVGKVTKVLNKLKALDKMTESDIFEEELIQEKLSANEVIQDNIAQLNA